MTEREFSDLVRRNRTKLVGFCARRVGGTVDDGEDLAQEATLILSRIMDSLDPPGTPMLFKAARFACGKHLKHRSVGRRRLDMETQVNKEVIEAWARSAPQCPVDPMMVEDMIGAFSSLLPHQRRVAARVLTTPGSYDIQAERLGVTARSVRQIMHEVRTQLLAVA